MRCLLALIFLGSLSAVALAEQKVVQTFDGSGAYETVVFHVHDGWIMEWDFKDPYGIDVTAPDRATVMGITGADKGAITMGKGGDFTLRINRTLMRTKLPWHIVIKDNVPDAPPPALATTTSPPASTNIGTPVLPHLPGIPSPTAGASNPLPGVLTPDQAHAVVLVKGDVGVGTGFLVNTPDGPAVITNIHVIFANPNIKIFTTIGTQVKITGLKGASDRDLAMFMIQDDHYSYLDLATDLKNTVQVGDQVVTPGNSEGGDVVLDTVGEVRGIGPDRIEFSNPIYHGNSGGPVFHVKSGKVIAVVTQAQRVDTSNDLDKTSSENANSAIKGDLRYFGFRPDNVPKWESYNWNQLLAETTFLEKFHEQSRCLDSFMNGSDYESKKLDTTDEYGPPNADYYQRDHRIQVAIDSFHKESADADDSQKIDARRELVLSLQGIADLDMTAIQNPNNFYSYDQTRAAYEIHYRKELRSEIDKAGDRISDMGH